MFSALDSTTVFWRLLTVTVLSLASCTNAPKSPVALDLGFVFHEATELSVDVFYEANAAPLAGETLSGRPYWSLAEDNLKAIFEGRDVAVRVNVPKNLGEMNEIPSKNKSSWTLQEIESLATEVALPPDHKKHARLTVLWLRGNLEREGEIKPTVLGVSLSGTSVVAIFKDVIESGSSSETSVIARYLEQSTLIHEVGHALGLVNNGVPLTSPHEDPDQGHHCSNSTCVLYWQNAGASDLIEFIRRMIVSGGNTVLFDEACLNDWRAF